MIGGCNACHLDVFHCIHLTVFNGIFVIALIPWRFSVSFNSNNTRKSNEFSNKLGKKKYFNVYVSSVSNENKRQNSNMTSLWLMMCTFLQILSINYFFYYYYLLWKRNSTNNQQKKEIGTISIKFAFI